MGLFNRLFSQKSLNRTIALEREYKEGETIIREGDRGAEFYIIKKGEVSILKKSDGHEIVLSVLGQGEFFGEMAIFEKMPRSATVRANKPTVVQIMFPGSFLVSIRQDPILTFQILQKMSKRIRTLSDELTRLKEEHEIKEQNPSR